MNEIVIDPLRYGNTVKLMVNRGAPQRIERMKRTVIDTTNVATCSHATRQAILPKTQLGMLQICIDKPFDGAWWMVVGSPHDEDLAYAAAFGIMLGATIASLRLPDSYARPLMWPLYGGTHDHLRDNEGHRLSMGGVGMLLLTNLAVDSTREKMEKARDLLSMYSSVPRVLVVAGADPLKFALDQLHATPSRVLYLQRGVKNTKQV